MIDFGSWKEKDLRVSTLSLDPRNPRIPDLGDHPSERDIIAALIEHEDVYELAKSIADVGGLYPSELLLAVEENDERVVVEGNRRLAALKLIDSPEKAPEAQVKKFRLLKERIPPQNIEKAKVSIAPSREAAAPVIVNRHTGNSLHRWQPGQQAKYIRTLVGPGYTIDDVAKSIGMSRSEIVKNLRTDTMLQVARTLMLPDDVRSKVQDPRVFSVSSLERLIQSPAALKFLGVEFDGDGGLVGHVEEAEFKKGYTRMVSDVAVANVDTRTLNGAEEIQEYLSSFGADTPNKQKKGVFTSASLLSGKTPASAAAIRTASPKLSTGPAVPRDAVYLIPKSFKFRLLSAPRIKEVFVELRSLKVAEFPNACAVLLRIFLEMVIGHYLDATGKIKPLLQAAQKKNKPADWYPPLSHLLNAVLQDSAITLKPLPKRGLQRMLSDDNSMLSLEHLNQFVHNQYVAPTERDLRKLWAMLEPLLSQLMEGAVAAGPVKKKSTP
jgi:hypothetical protein